MAPYLGGERLVLTTWLAGSFVSSKFDPDNLDVTVFVDGERVALCQGKPGIGQIKRFPTGMACSRRSRSAHVSSVSVLPQPVPHAARRSS